MKTRLITLGTAAVMFGAAIYYLCFYVPGWAASHPAAAGSGPMSFVVSLSNLARNFWPLALGAAAFFLYYGIFRWFYNRARH